MRVGNASGPPCVQALKGQAELVSHQLAANALNDFGVGVSDCVHTPQYQNAFDISSGFDFISTPRLTAHIFGVSFAERLTSAWKAAGFKSERQAALACEVSPQRFNSWTSDKGTRPDHLTLERVARVLKTTPRMLLNEEDEPALKGILLHLFQLEGIPDDRADNLANVVIEARRLLEVFPEDAPLDVRASHAALAAWRQRQSPPRGT